MAPGIAIVTGASSGIGRATAIALVESGWKVVLSGRRESQLQETAQMSGNKGATLVVQSDLLKHTDVARLFDECMKKYGRLDLIFNNAGMGLPGVPIEEIKLEDWQTIVNINLTAPFLCTQYAVKIMKNQEPKGGRIINNGSISAHTPRPNSLPYTATKHAITGLTKSTNLDGRKFNIVCGQIDVGNAESEMANRMKAGVPQADGSVKAEAMMNVNDVARSVVYMASLPLEANIPFLTVMASKMPLFGRG